MILKYFLFIILMLAITGLSEAQQPEESNLGRINKISEELSVSHDKAREIIRALDYNRSELEQALHDTTLNPYDKQQRISSLLAGRKVKVREVLSSDQINRLKGIHTEYKEKFLRERRQAETKHEEKLKNAMHGAILKSREKVSANE